MLSERIQRLLDNREKNAKQSEIIVRDQAYEDGVKNYPDSSVSEQYAHGFANALARKSILIQKEDLLAGFLYQYTYNVNFPMKVSPDFDASKRAKFRMDVKREMELARVSEEESKEFTDMVDTWLLKHWHSGHTVAGYEKLLNKGFGGLLKEVKNSGNETTDAKAFVIVLEACIQYVERYEKLARQMIEEYGPSKDRIRLLDALIHIKTNPPGSFFEALQLLWIAHEMMYVENIPSAISLGRVDYYLYPFYEHDIREGIIDQEEALELIEAFWVKCSSQRKSYQNLTLGGCGEDGKTSANELTALFLRAAMELRVDQPSVDFRWTDDMPTKIWDEVYALIMTGMGFPAMMYDPCCIKAQLNCGKSEEDVWNYGFIGCVELGIPGKENALTELARLNLPKLLNLILNAGEDTEQQVHFQMKNEVEIKEILNYESFEKLFFDELDYWIRKTLYYLDVVQKVYAKYFPLPYLSVLTEDCIGRGLDVNAGGSRYHSVGFNLGGIATAADSLAAIKKCVFEEEMITLSELRKVLNADFEGRPEVLRYLTGKCPKYGNDIEEVDNLARRIEMKVSNVLKEYRTPFGGHYRLGLYTVEDHAIMGSHTGATADGRRRGEALSNSSGASQGKDKEGPTALINSVTGFPMVYSENGMVLDLKFTPSSLEGETGKRMLKSLIETYFHKGGMEIQISVVSRKTLEEAQRNPKEYENLIVRVSGFSAYFCSLSKVTQDEIIKRTQY